MEIAKWGLFYADMGMLQTVLTTQDQSSATGSAGEGAQPVADNPRVKIIHAIKSRLRSSRILWIPGDWSKWQAAHHDNLEFYGTISAAGFDFQLFQILQNGNPFLRDQ